MSFKGEHVNAFIRVDRHATHKSSNTCDRSRSREGSFDEMKSNDLLSCGDLEGLLKFAAVRLPKESVLRILSEVVSPNFSLDTYPDISTKTAVSADSTVDPQVQERRRNLNRDIFPSTYKADEFPVLNSEISTVDARKLLNKVFPADTLPNLVSDVGGDICGTHPSVSVFFSDIVGFTEWSSKVQPANIINCLSAYFQILDDLAERLGVYKVETIGDAWMAVCGAPDAHPDHAQLMAMFALEAIDTVEDMRAIFDHPSIDVRVGIHSGSVVSGIVRADRPRWQLFGDTVNMASRMESTGVPGKVQISSEFHDLLENSNMSFITEERGLVQVKGKGHLKTYFLTGMGEDASNQLKSGGTRLSYLNETSFNRSRSTPRVSSISAPCESSKSLLGPCAKDDKSRKEGRKLSWRGLEVGRRKDSLVGMLNQVFVPKRKVSLGLVDSLQFDLVDRTVASEKSAATLSIDRRANSIDQSFIHHQMEKVSLDSSCKIRKQSLNGLTSCTSGVTQISNDGGRSSVLLVDETASTLMQYRRLFNGAGVHVVLAHNFQEAMACMHEREFSVVYMDPDMKSMPSLTSITEFRDWEKNNRTQRQIIVALVASPSSIFSESVLAAGVDNVECKTNSKEGILKYVWKSWMSCDRSMSTKQNIMSNS